MRSKLAVAIPYIFQTKKSELNYLYPFMSYSVENFCGLTDGRTFLEKVFFFLHDQEYILIYIYMSIPISIISEISPPYTQS